MGICQSLLHPVQQSLMMVGFKSHILDDLDNGWVFKKKLARKNHGEGGWTWKWMGANTNMLIRNQPSWKQRWETIHYYQIDVIQSPSYWKHPIWIHMGSKKTIDPIHKQDVHCFFWEKGLPISKIIQYVQYFVPGKYPIFDGQISPPKVDIPFSKLPFLVKLDPRFLDIS